MVEAVEPKVAPRMLDPRNDSFLLDDSDTEPLSIFRFLPLKRKRVTHDCKDCRTTHFDIKALERHRRSDSHRIKSGLTPGARHANCTSCGSRFDLERARRSKEAQDYQDLSELIATQLSFADPAADRSVELSQSNETDLRQQAESDATILHSVPHQSEDVDLTPFSLIDDERWGTEMSATLPFLSGGDVAHHDVATECCRNDDSPRSSAVSNEDSKDARRESDLSIDEPPPEYARHDPATPTMEDLPPILLRSDVDQAMSQVEFERARGLKREDSAVGLTWRSDLSAWERKVDKKPRSHRSSSTTEVGSEPTVSPVAQYRSPVVCITPASPTILPPTSPAPPPLPAGSIYSIEAVLHSSETSLDSVSINPNTRKPLAPPPTPPTDVNAASQQKAARVTFTQSVRKKSEPVKEKTEEKQQKFKSVPQKSSNSPRGSTLDRALYKAVYCGDLEKAQQLLRMGTNPDIIHGNNGILCAAAMWGHVQVGKIMQAHQIDEAEGKCLTCQMGPADLKQDLNVVKALLAHGIDAKHQGELCGSPISTAAWMGKPEIVNVLLAHGAELNQSGGKYRTPLCASAAEAGFAGNLEVVKVLVQAGAVVHAFGPHGSALSLAMKRRDFWLRKAEECPTMADVEKRIASCDLMVRFLERAEAAVRNNRKSGSAGSSPERR